MNACVIYFSRTGNTKRLAQAIATAAKAPIIDIATAQPSTIKNFGLLIVGTPVEGSKPAKETLTFLDALPKTVGKKAIVFCTYRFWKGSTLRILEKQLTTKGYEAILSVSKKGMKPEKEADFSDIVDEVTKTLEKL
jgi:flavodoxin